MPEQQGFEEAVVQKILQQVDPLVSAVAQQMGPGANTQRYSEADQVKLWSFSPIADPAERAKKMLELHQQGLPPEQITDQVYPNRRGLIESGRPKVKDQIAYAQRMDRLMARSARDLGVHFPHDPTWARITEPNAPAETPTMSEPSAAPPPATLAPSAPAPAGGPAPAGTSPINVAPTQATSTPGWAVGSGGLFG
jgi:hypothetical protein